MKDQDQIQVLGCSGGIGAGLKTTCFRLNETLLIDAGTGLETLDRSELARIRSVFITHAHLDHVCCLPLMLASVYNPDPRPISVFASEDTLKDLREHIFNWRVWPDYSVLPHPERPSIKFFPVEEGKTYSFEGLEINARTVSHSVPCLGYQVRSQRSGASLAFSGDSSQAGELWRHLAQTEALRHLIVDVSFPNELEALAAASGHFTPAMLAADLAPWGHRLDAGQTWIHVTHIKPGYEETVMRQCQEALSPWPIRALRQGEWLQF